MRVRPSIRKLLMAAAVCAALAPAHDIPSDTTVRAFVRPTGDRMQLLVRAPLNSMHDIEFPTTGPGYLVISEADQTLRDAAKVWIADAVEIYENDRRLPRPTIEAVMASLESDRSFFAIDEALAHVTGPPLPDDINLPAQQAMLDVLLEYPIESENSEFSIRLGLDRLGVRVLNVLWFVPPTGEPRPFEFSEDPGIVRLDPRWHQAALRFVELGFQHILDGTDHLLFLFCLVIPFRRIKPLLLVVTAFTIAHSITLIASAFNLAPDALWFPPLIETLIAASIVYMALENIVGNLSVQHRWMIAFGFGLVHGFGFSFALRETLQFAGKHLLTSLLSFNVGVELGQILVLLLLVPALALLFRFVVAERIGSIILSAFVAHTGWHWMSERWAVLKEYPSLWNNLPTFSSTLIALAALGLAGGSLWLASPAVRKAFTGAAPGRDSAAEKSSVPGE